jgi:mono/diheme cytochrome c family protein
MKNKYFNSLKNIALTALVALVGTGVSAQDGEQIFKQNCAVCHKVTAQRLVGPGLQGVAEKRSREWLKKFIANSQGFINSGDADAKAIWEEYNKTIMPEQALNDADLDAVIDYIAAQGGGAAATTAAAAPAEEVADAPFTAEDVAAGKLYFEGSNSFENGGPSCISCHNVNDPNMINGGLLAKDLTDANGRMGNAGVEAILSMPPFPAMAASYKSNPLTNDEIRVLSAYLKNVSETADPATADNGYSNMLMGGFGGFLVLIIIVALLWADRRRKMVKHDIFNRQIKSI